MVIKFVYTQEGDRSDTRVQKFKKVVTQYKILIPRVKAMLWQKWQLLKFLYIKIKIKNEKVDINKRNYIFLSPLIYMKNKVKVLELLDLVRWQKYTI